MARAYKTALPLLPQMSAFFVFGEKVPAPSLRSVFPHRIRAAGPPLEYRDRLLPAAALIVESKL